MFSDEDIRKQIELAENKPGQGIKIEPFALKNLTPVGYDIRVGKQAFSWNKRCVTNIERTGTLEIGPKDTVVIETYESVSLSKNISATIHAMATLTIEHSLSHISTTIDPGWTGTMLIAIHNPRKTSVQLDFKSSFCTVCFYQVKSQSQIALGREPDRADLWRRLKNIANQQKNEERKNNLIYFILAVISLSFACGVVGWISFKGNTALGAVLATLFSGILPIVYTYLKDQTN